MTTETTAQPTGDTTQAAAGAQSTDTTTTQAAPVNGVPPGAKTDAAPGAPADTPPAEVVYDLKLPDGIELDAASSDEFKALAKELKLSPEAAQKFVDLEAKRIQASAQAHAETVKGWRDSVVNDKDIGGDKLAENIATAKKAIALGPPELIELLKQTGMDNHPTVFRWCLAVGKSLSEDRMVQGSAAATAAPKTAAQVLYPSNT